MAKQKFIDSAGREAYVDTSTNKVYTEGGNKDTFYTLDQWNKRQLDKYGKPSSSSSSSTKKTSSSSSNKSTDYSSSNVSSFLPQTPALDLNKLYQTAMTDPALTTLEADLNTKKQALNTAQSNINDNPFYSEATRTGKLQKLETSANNDIALVENQVAQKKADAQVKLNIAQQQYNIDNEAYKTNLTKLNTLLTSGALVNASGNDIAQIAVATGLTTGMINSMIEKIKTDAIKPQVIQETDDNGNVTVSVIDSATGKLISQNSLGNIAKATKSTTSNSGGTTITGNKVTDKDIGVAISILDKQDNANYGTKDKRLSAWEISAALNELVAKYGNTDVAYQLLAEAMNRGGYEEWKG